MPTPLPTATHHHIVGDVHSTLEFLKKTREMLRVLRRVRVWQDRVQVFDVNGDFFEVQGIGYESPDVPAILAAVHTAFNPETIHLPCSGYLPFKEFKTGRRHPWAEDRVM